VHTRESNADTLTCLEKYNETNVLLHGFAGTESDVKRAMDLGYYITIPSSVVVRKRYQKIALTTNLEQMMLETDTPYHLPFRPKSAKRIKNTPLGVILGAKKIAELLDLEFEEVAQITTKNTQQFFHI